MNEERRNDIVLTEVDPKEGTLTAWPFQVGIIMRDGKVEEVFSEGKRNLRRGMFQKGEVRAFIAYTSSFNLIFWLKDPGDPSEPSEGITFGQPVLTADRQIVTGRIGLTLSVMPDNVEYLLQLLDPRGSVITQPDIAREIRDELLDKVLALDLYRYTASELRGNEELLRGVYCSLKTQLAATICRYGLKLDNFNVNWGLTLEERERIKDQRHGSAIRDIERELELEEARKPQEPTETERPQPSPPPPTPPPGPPVPEPTVQNAQSYSVFTDQPTSMSTINEESCRFYQNRRDTRRTDNWWHGPYASKEQAASSPENVGQVRECGICRP